MESIQKVMAKVLHNAPSLKREGDNQVTASIALQPHPF